MIKVTEIILQNKYKTFNGYLSRYVDNTNIKIKDRDVYMDILSRFLYD